MGNKILNLPVYLLHKVDHRHILSLSFRARWWWIYVVAHKEFFLSYLLSPIKTLTIVLKVTEVWMLFLQEKRMLLGGEATKSQASCPQPFPRVNEHKQNSCDEAPSFLLLWSWLLP